MSREDKNVVELSSAEVVLTAFELLVLLHYYEFSSPIEISLAWAAEKRLLDLGLIKSKHLMGNAMEISDRGRVYVKALLTTPLPVQVQMWKMPV